MKQQLFRVATSIGLLLCGTLGIGKPILAQQVVNNTKSSPVEIKVVQKMLRLTKVGVPNFQEIITGNEQIIKASNGLEIDVTDEREDIRSPWGLMYQLTFFSTQNQQVLSEQRFFLGKGTLTAESGLVASEDYQGRSIVVTEQGQEVLHVSDTSYKTYRYCIPKEKIMISIPKNAKEGIYTATQVVQLTSLPVIP